MYIVTNRNLKPKAPVTERFGTKFNELGPNELRLAKAQKVNNVWQVDVLPDQKVNDMWPSEISFLEAQARMCANRTNCLFFVHGYNVSFEDVLEEGQHFADLYNVEVVVFTWPSDGGGALPFPPYKDMQRNAALSIGALDRCFEKLGGYIAKYRNQACGQKFTLALHSMGNFLLKRLLDSSIYQGETLLFDNIIMLAADVNNKDHAEWVDRIKFRNRLFVSINEDDFALAASRAKGGEQQQARLGHWIKNLNARHAMYLNFTEGDLVDNSHNYYSDGNALNNPNIRRVWQSAFNGGRAEQGLPYDSGTNTYRVS
jgi:esterase/lipase superfamily enzyme